MAAPHKPFDLTRVPGGLWLEALTVGLARQARVEWFGTPMHLATLNWPRVEGLTAWPRDFRPAKARQGRDLLGGRFELAGDALALGAGGDPWDRASPTRRFAAALHRFEWLPHLLTQDEAGAIEAIRLIGQWDTVFGRWNPFVWSGEVLDRRAFNLACGAGVIARRLETQEDVEGLGAMLAKHARQLLQTAEPRGRRAQRLAAAAVAAACLAGAAGDKLLAAALKRLEAALSRDVLPDGVHASRAPEAGLELLFDLLTLDDVLAQRGLERPARVGEAMDRLSAALRFFVMRDGRLPSLQGSEALEPPYVAAARAPDASAAPPPAAAPHGGFQRMECPGLEVIVDAAPPARGALSTTATAQPAALEITAGGERLISNSAWSARAPNQQAQRLTGAGSTAALGAGSAGAPVSGLRARLLGARLVRAPREVTVRRTATAQGALVQLSHDGWMDDFGLVHERRLYLDAAADELRGEDRFEPRETPKGRLLAYAVAFHLFPGASASIARDNRSVLLRTRNQTGWWLRNDATEVRIEPAVHFVDGQPRAVQQVVLRGHFHADKGGKVRWKIVQADRS